MDGIVDPGKADKEGGRQREPEAAAIVDERQHRRGKPIGGMGRRHTAGRRGPYWSQRLAYRLCEWGSRSCCRPGRRVRIGTFEGETPCWQAGRLPHYCAGTVDCGQDDEWARTRNGFFYG